VTALPTRRNQLIWLWVLQCCLLLRVLVPAGYMPSSLAEGGPIVLCPNGSAIASLLLASGDEAPQQSPSEHSGHHSGHHPGQHGQQHGSGDEPSLWEVCPVGVLFGVSGLVQDVAISIPALQPFIPEPLDSSLLLSSTLLTFRARDPPPPVFLTA